MPHRIIDQHVEATHDGEGSVLRHSVAAEHVPARVLDVTPFLGNGSERDRILAAKESVALRDQLGEWLIDLPLAPSRSAEDPRKDFRERIDETDRRNPRINANGSLYGALELSADYVPVLDPKTHRTSH